MQRSFVLLSCLLVSFLSINISASAQTANMELLYNWTNPSLPGSSAFNNTYNEVWGFEQNGTKYGVVGSTWGTYFFDLSDPDNIQIVDSVEGAYTGGGVIHRDYHDYKGYLYAVCDEGVGTSTLQIIDLSTLPESVSVVYDDLDKFTTSHNIFIDSVIGRLYVMLVNFNPGSSSMAVYDIATDPTDPQFLKVYNDGTQFHDGHINNGIGFFNDGYNSRFLIMDWTDHTNPVILGSLDNYPDMGYNHSGWPNEDGSIYVFADEDHGHAMKVCDVTDPTDINVVSTIFSGVDAMSIPHNQFIRGDLLYTAYYHDGIYIHDISDPADPKYVTHYKTYQDSDHSSYRGAWGVFPFPDSDIVLVSDMQYGFFAFRVNGLPSGIDDPILKVESVFPNPATEQITVQVNLSESSSATLSLFNLKGQIIKSINAELVTGANTMNLQLPQELAGGLYMLRLDASGDVFTEQFIKISQD
ncbi:MAG: choice-of-anchor B domain-containing protein [Limisphaerales bacterium]|jgi:choice-of-anchor B domain-containing protein